MSTTTYPTRVNWWMRLASILALMVAILGWASPLSAQTITTAGANPPYNGGNGVSGNGVVTFGVENNSGADILLTDLSSYWQTASTGANTTLWASTISLGGVYFPFNAPDWTVVGTGTNLAVPAEGIQPTITGMTYLIPNGASVRFLLESDNAIRYSGTGAISPNSFTVGGISLRCGDYQMVPGQNVGYGGLFSNTGNNPRYFTGSLTFIPAAACAGQPAAGSISGPPFVCSGGSATLNVNGSTLGTGITRVWYSSPTSGGPYTTLVGTGTSVSTGPVTSTTYYVCVVTCTNSSLSDQTAEFQLPVQGAGAGGTFTIDNSLPTAGSNFNDFTDAINYLNLLSVCGPFTGTYTFNVAAGQVFNENTPVLTASGSPGNTITFQRSGVGANPVITPTGTAGTADAGITISGGDHIVFNGIDIDASAVAAVEYGYLIRNRSATDGATFNIIENCTIRLNRTNTTSRGILQTSTTTGGGATPTDFGGTNSANTYRNLTIRNCFSGIWINGGSNAFYDEGNVITTTACGIYNSIGDPNVFADIGSSTNALQAYGVQMTNQVNFAVQNCEIRNVSNTTSQLDGINITLFAGQCSVSNNIIRGITGTGTTTLAMAGIRATHSTTTGVPQPTLRVYNNVISEIHRPYTGTATATRGPRGLYFLSTSAVNTPVIEVWNNTVVIDGSANPLLSNACFEHTNPTTGTTWSVRNNIFQNNTIAQGATARHYGVVHTPSATVFGNTGSVVSNNDVFIANDLGVSGFTALSGAAPAGNRNGVAAWQTAVAQATGNLQLNALLDAGFVSSQAGLDGTGFSPAPGYLTTDLACAPRQADIGAYNIVQCTTPVAGTIAGSGAGCDGQSNILSLAGASNGLGITYQWWYGAPGGPYTNPLGTGSSQNTSALPIGSYELVADVTCSAGPTTVTTAPFALTVNAVPTASASAGAACLGGTLQLTGTTDIGTSFSWSGPNSFNSTAQNPSVNPVVAASAGTYSFTATAAGCSSTPATVLVNTVTPPAITSVTAAPNPVCIGDDTQLLAIATAPGYVMGATGSSFIDISGTGTAIPAVGDDTEHNITIPGGFTFNGVNYTDARIGANGVIVFGSTTGDISLTNAALPTGTVAAGNAFLAPWWDDIDNDAGGGQIFIGQSGDLLIAQWNNWGRSAAVAGQVITFQVQLNQVTGQIFFVYQDVIFGGTQAAANDNGLNATVGIQWANAVGSAIQYSFNTASLTDGQVISFTPNTPSYSWTPNTYLTADNIANPMAQNVLADITYTMTVTAGGCSSSQNLLVEANPAILPSEAEIIPDPAAFCTGGSVTLTAVPLGGGGPYTFTWTDPNLVVGTPTNVATQSANIAGLWSVQIDDACGGTATASITVVENPTPSASASASQACIGGTLQLTGTTDIGTSFTWTGPNSFASTSQNPTVNPVVAASGGTYIFTATAGPCTSASSSVVVVADISPVISATTATPNPVCSGNDSQLNVFASVPGYTMGAAGATFIDISGTGTPVAGVVGDDTEGNITITGGFTFNGINYTSARVGANGALVFGAATGEITNGNAALPSAANSAGSVFLAPFWDDLDNLSPSNVYTQQVGSLFIVQWHQWGHFSAATEGEVITFQIQMDQVTGAVYFVYQDVIFGGAQAANDAGASATVGIQWANSAGNFIQYSFNTASLTDGQVISFTPVAVSSYLWTPNTFLSDDAIANPVAQNPTATTPYSVLATGANGCTATGNVTLTLNQSLDVDLARIQDCLNSQFSISVQVNSTGNGPTVDLSYTVNGGSPIGVPGLGTGPQTPLGPFNATDDVEVTVIDPVGGCNLDGGVFRSGCPEIVNCPAVLTKTHCYDNNDTKTWYFKAANPGETLTLTFIAGTMDPNDLIRGYSGSDNNGIPIVELTGSFADLGVPQVIGTSSGAELYLEIDSDGSNSCQDSQQSSWLFEVECTPGCVNPIGSVNPIPNCVAQNFTIDVTADFVGDGAFVDIEYIVNGGTPVVIPGVLEGATENIGPFDFGDDVQVFLNHENDNACNLNLGFTTLTQSACPNEIPCSAWILGMNPNYTCVTTSAGNMTGSTLAPGITGGCTGVVQDQWYRFTATATTHRVQLGGTTTGLSHSIYTGNPDCTNLQLVAGTACVAGATASNPAGLTIGQIYYVRVSRTTVGTNAYTVCVSAPPLIDADATVLALPLATACYGANETVSVTVLNNAIYPLDMSVNPLTVNVSVTGPVVTNLSGTFNTGIVAPGATINVPMSTTLNMSAAGTYTFNGTCVVVGDGNAANDPMTAATRTTVAPFAVPFTQNFTGFSGANLATLVAPNNGWREATGAAVPTGTTSAWTSSAAAQQTALGSGVSARIQMTTTARNEWIVGPKFVPVLGTQMSYRIALTEFGTGGVDAGTPSPGMQPGDEVIVKVSTDCGASFNTLLTHNATTPTGLTNALQNQLIDLSGFAGQEVIIAFHATKPASTPHPNYDFHLDDINIQNVAVCSGSPTAGTANSSNAGPACAPASTTLSVSGQSTDGGIVVTWWGSNTPGGPYTINQGSGTVLGVSGLTATRYWKASVKCTLSGDSVLTAEVSTVVTPTPTASASAGPACTGETLNLFGATDFGTSFTWTGPDSFNSTAQNPSIAAVTTAAAGTYTFTATANGCTSSSQVVVTVNIAPVITSVTGTPNPVCIGDDSQLQATAPVSGYFMGAGGASFIDISGTGAPVTPVAGDDTEHNVTIPGGFIFNGTSYTDIRIGSNGVVVFGSTTGDVSLTNAVLPSTAHSAGNVFLAPFWDDMDDGPATPAGNIFTQQVGNVFIIQWQTYGHFSATSGQNITFQVQLDQVANVVYFVYQDVFFGGTQSTLDAGLSATVGIQWAASAGNFIQYSFNTASLTDGQVISFTPNQATFAWTPNTYLTSTSIADPVAQNVLADVTYTVVATAANGCVSAPAQLILEANPPIQAGQAEINPDPAGFCTGSDNVLTAVPLGGGGPYTFTWTDPNLVTGAPSASPNITVNIAGTWSVLIEDGCGSNASASVVVTEYPVPVASASSNSPVCAGEPINLDGSSTVGGSTFAWSGPDGFDSDEEDPVLVNSTLAMIGTYSVVASANGCSSAPATTSVLVNVTPTTPVVNLSVWSLCPGGSVDLTASSTALTTLTYTGGAITIPAAPNTGGTGALSISNPYPSTIAVSGLPTSGVTVKQVLINGFTHTFPSDVDMLLRSPNGTNVVIMSDAGSGTDATGFDYVFQDGGAAMTTTVNPSGTYAPFNSGATDDWFTPGPGSITQATPTLASFSGDPNGTWNLFVSDDIGGDVGSLTSWSIVFEYNNVTYSWTGAGLNTNSGPNVTATPASTTTYTVSAENDGCTASADAIVHIGNNELALEVSTDANGDELSYEFREEGTNTLFYAVGENTLPNNALSTNLNCLPDGCYYLVVVDAGGDGIVGGGYLLRENDGSQRRIIDNRRDAFGNGGFTNGGSSQIAGNEGFCLPLGSDRLVYTSCDKLDWRTSPCGAEYVVATDNATVTAQYGVNNANSGYQMWWYNPNGGYSFKRFQSHSTSNGLPASATRACHFLINSWSGNQLQQGVLYNVKVRGRVNGDYLPWGYACRFMVSDAAAQCPRTKLMDLPGNQYLSCGQTRTIASNQLVHARNVRRRNANCNWVNANRYQFRFRIPAESVTIVKTSATGQYWTNTLGLTCGKTYEVDVRASFDNGATWCHAGDPYGDVCQLTTLCSGAMALESGNANEAGQSERSVGLYPNPNRGDQLFVSMSQVEQGVETVSIDIYDGFGKRVATRTIAAQDGFLSTVIDLDGTLANGMYLVSITAGSEMHNERLVIQK